LNGSAKSAGEAVIKLTNIPLKVLEVGGVKIFQPAIVFTAKGY
jgi:hypothetical protein